MSADVPEEGTRVRLIDAVGVGWTVATAFTTTRAQAIAVLPLWTLVGYLSPSIRHFGRVVVVDVHRRHRGLIDLRRVLTLMLVWLVCAATLSAALALAGRPLSPWWQMVSLLIFTPGVVVLLGHRRPPGGGFGDPPGEWIIAMLAGRPGSNALPAVVRLVERLVPVDANVGVRAADERRARLFELRYGFRVPNPSRPLELIRDARDA